MSTTILSRRHFIQCVSSCIAVSASSKLIGCQNGENTARTNVQRTIRLGPLSSIPMGEYIFFVERLLTVRDQTGLGAMSLVCTHQGCMVQRQEVQPKRILPQGLPHDHHATDKKTANDFEYRCPCHGSVFDYQGTVLVPPAQRSLPWYEVILETSHSSSLSASNGTADTVQTEGETDIHTVSVVLGKVVNPEWRLKLPVSG